MCNRNSRDRTTCLEIFACITCFAALTGLLAGQWPADKREPKVAVTLPPPRTLPGDAAAKSEACIVCHAEIVELLEGDKHIADDFHCVVCHGESQSHVEADVEGALPDRTWRRWDEDQNRYEWRIKDASLQIARYCASCHARRPAAGQQTAAINWRDFLDTGHGAGVLKNHRDAPTCTDCHYAHGAGCEPLTDETIVQRCGVCHGDQEMMKRAGLDPDVMESFAAESHADMDSVPAAEKSSCVKCHEPH